MRRQFAASCLLSASATLAAVLLLRNLGRLLAFDAQFSAIFAQLRTAPIRSPIALPFVLALGYACLSRRWSRGATVAVGVLVWLALLALCLGWTQVNGVYFADVLATLIPLIVGGGL